MRWPLVAAAGSAAVSVAGLALIEVNGGSVLGDFNADLFIVGTIYAVVGGVILDRVPGNWLGRVLLVAGWLWALDLLLNQYAIYGIVTVPGSLAAAGFASWMAAWLWIPGNSLLLSGTPLLFPNGRLLSRRWLPVAAIIVVGVVASVIGHAVVVWPIRDTAQALDRSFDAADVPGLAGTLASIGDMIGFLFAPFAAIAALVVRYRRAHGIARQQMRWFTAAIALAACGAVLDQVATLVWPESQGALSAPALALVPVALAIAVLRYHLYDIDRIISRTLAGPSSRLSSSPCSRPSWSRSRASSSRSPTRTRWR